MGIHNTLYLVFKFSSPLKEPSFPGEVADPRAWGAKVVIVLEDFVVSEIKEVVKE